MDLDEAYRILKLEKIGSLKDIKRQYYKLALENHPDKNGNTEESKIRFQEINEAYEVIQREMCNESNYFDRGKEETDESKHFFRGFETIMKKAKDVLFSLAQTKIIEHIDRETAEQLLPFLMKYRDLLQIEEETIQQLQEKCKNIETLVIHPTLRDLLENNVYKWERDGEWFYAPLWHSEMTFMDRRGSEILVKCVPNLPTNVSIDENNDLYIRWTVPFTVSLLHTKVISVSLPYGEEEMKTWNIPVNQLRVQEEQRYVFKKQGMAKINERDMYNIEQRGDIICMIVFV